MINSTNLYVAQTHLHFQPLAGEWICGQNKGRYRIFINPKDLFQSHAEITSLHGRTITHITWAFPVLSKTHVFDLITKQPHSFQVEVQRKAGQFQLSLHSKIIEEEIEGIYAKLNSEIFSQDTGRLNLNVNYYREIEDHEARKAFFLDILKKFGRNRAYRIMTANVLSILNRAGFSFAHYDLEGIQAPYANLKGALLANAHLSQADLSHANLEQTCLTQTDLTASNLKDVNFGEVPFFSHTLTTSIQTLSHSFLPLATNEKFIVSADHSLYLWDAKTGALIETIPGFKSEEICSLSFSQNGNWLFFANKKGELKALNFTYKKTYDVISQGHKSENITTFLKNDVLFYQQLTTLTFYQLQEKHDQITPLKPIEIALKAITSPIKDIALFSQAKQICILTSSLLFILDSSNGKIIRQIPLDIPYDHVAISANDQFLLLSRRGTLHLRNLFSIRNIIITEVVEGENKISFAQFMLNDQFLFYVINDRTICQYHIPSQKEVLRYEATSDPLMNLQLSVDHQSLMLIDKQKRFFYWNLQEMQKKIPTFHGVIHGVHFTEDRDSLFAYLNDNQITKYSMQTGHALAIEEFKEFGKMKEMLVGGLWQDPLPLIRDVYKIRTSPAIQDLMYRYSDASLENFTISPDFRYFALIIKTGMLKIIDTQDKKLIGLISLVPSFIPITEQELGFRHLVMTLEHSSNQIILAITMNSLRQSNPKIILWQIDTHLSQVKHIGTLQRQALTSDTPGQIKNLQFSADHQFLFSAQSNENFICQWSLKHQQIVKQFEGHLQPVISIDLHPKTALLLSGSKDRTVRLWNLHANDTVTELPVYVDIERVQFSPCGAFFIVVAEGGRAIYTWKIYNEGSQIQPQLLWRQPPKLECQALKISSDKEEKGYLSASHRALLLQRGAQLV